MFRERHTATLKDGRRVAILVLDDGSIRFKVNGGPYMLTEFYPKPSDGPHDYSHLRLTQVKEDQ